MALVVDTPSQKPYSSKVLVFHIPRCCFNLRDVTISI